MRWGIYLVLLHGGGASERKASKPHRAFDIEWVNRVIDEHGI